jgi:hypothetical protein
MAKLNGTSLTIVVDGITMGGSKSFTLTINSDLPDVSTKSSSGWKENIYGQRSWTVSFDGLYDPSLTYNVEEIFDELDSRDEVYLEMATIDGSGGGLVWSGYARASNLTIVADMEQPVSISGTFEGTGEINKGTIASS